MIFLFAVLFAQVDIDINTEVNMYYSYPAANLFFIHPGFADPSASRGLIGFTQNPAGLMRESASGLMLTIAPSMKTLIQTEFAVPLDSITDILDTIRIPARLGFEQVGGFDFLGVMIRIKDWRLGIGLQKGDYLRLDFNADARAQADCEVIFDDTLTSDDIGGIPLEDSIPVHFEFSGSGEVSVAGGGDAQYESNSFVIAIARRFLGLDIGLGWQLTPVAIEGDVNAWFGNGLLAGLSLSVQPGSDWDIDASFDSRLEADSLVGCEGNADLEFYLSTVYWGIKKDWRYFSFGLCGEFSPPLLVDGGWEAMTRLPGDIPKIRFEDDSLIVDTVQKKISGHATLVIYDFERDDTTYRGDLTSLFMSSNGVTGGMSLRVWRFETGIFGGLNFSSDGTYLKTKFGIDVGLRTFIPLRAGAILHFQYFNVGGLPITALPVLSLGCGTDFRIKKLNFFVNVSGNTTQGASSLVIPGIVGGEPTLSALFSLGLGVLYRF
jgi:hypothetical protein